MRATRDGDPGDACHVLFVGRGVAVRLRREDFERDWKNKAISAQTFAEIDRPLTAGPQKAQFAIARGPVERRGVGHGVIAGEEIIATRGENGV